jgi:hypothetical protein
VASKLIPVVLPPGRANELTKLVFGNRENRNRGRRLLSCADCSIPTGHHDVEIGIDQFRGDFRELTKAQPKPARSIVKFWPGPAKLIQKRNKLRRISWKGQHPAEMISSPKLLRSHSEWRQQRCGRYENEAARRGYA